MENENWSVPHTMCQDNFQIDQRFNCTILNHTTTRKNKMNSSVDWLV